LTPAEYKAALAMEAFGRGDYGYVLESAMSHAIAGNPDAQCMVSLLYQCGLGVKRDLTEAERWLLKAAEQDSALAWNNLGSLYAIGDPSLAHAKGQARACYLKAKKLGFKAAEPYPPPSCE
jgi:uncharacterized protein